MTFQTVSYAGRTYWIRVKANAPDEQAIRDVTAAEDLAYALRTSCNVPIDWKAIKQALKVQQKSHQEPV